MLSAVGGVDIVRPLVAQNGELAFELIPKGEDDLRPAIFRAAVDSGLTLIGLAREGQNLEDIFRQLTVGNQA